MNKHFVVYVGVFGFFLNVQIFCRVWFRFRPVFGCLSGTCASNYAPGQASPIPWTLWPFSAAETVCIPGSHPDQAPLITLNSWNEWTETSYLEPDDLYGYGYLEAVRRVFKGRALNFRSALNAAYPRI
jgi:hypothetical protein